MRTENKVDEIKNTLDKIHSGFTEIEGQIERGFKGTDADLKQIKEIIDNVEQDLQSLVQRSKDVDGKEGECIREFAVQTLEVMKEEILKL